MTAIKVSVSDILSVLRRYELATDDNYNRQVDQVQRTTPDDQSTVVTFRFQKTKFYIIFDHRADDDVDYLTEIVTDLDSNAFGHLVENPRDSEKTYGMPFKGKDIYLFEVDPQKRRLDSELATKYPETSRSTWQKYIKQGYVLINGEPAVKAKQEIRDSDDISVSIPEATDFSESELPILYIDDNVIVVNKPIGVLTHSKGVLNDEFSVADFFGRYCEYHADTNRPGIVHRLDRDTSGVIIGARNQSTADLLQEQFAQRKTNKTYYAIVKGVPKEPVAIIDLPIARNPSKPSTFKVDSKGKSAQTSYEVLAVANGLSLVKLQPKTGRTHQLRVHMAYINTPILGDRVYGKAADRLYLHAKSLEITIPISDRKTFDAPLPAAFLDHFPDTTIE